MKKALFILMSLLAGCGLADDARSDGAAEQIGSTYESFESFEARTLREPGTGIYIVDGDKPILSREGLREFYEQHVRKGALVIHQQGSVDDRWSDTQKLNLTYCVSKDFYNYDRVVQVMATAAADWESAAGINFIHIPSEDDACLPSNNNVLFDVQPMIFMDTPDYSYMRAFFPGMPREARSLIVPSHLEAPYGLEGMLRHLLGHVLGFDHEFVRPEAGSRICYEDVDPGAWRELTPYDAASVMYYSLNRWCAERDAGDLVLTAQDKQGARSVYGPPFVNAFTLLEPANADLLKGDETNLLPGDFNGDGLTDLLRQEKNTWDDDALTTAQVWLSRDDGTFNVVNPMDADLLKGDETNLILGDFDGDGDTDFLRQEKNTWDDNALTTAQVWLSRRDGTFDVVGLNDADLLKGDETNLIPGYFNRDNRMDFLRQEKNTWDDDALTTAQVWLSRDDGTFDIRTPNDADLLKGDETNLITGDFNRDGLTDLLRQEKNTWDDDALTTAQVWLSRGDGTFHIVNPIGADLLKGDETNLIPGDFDGNACTDFLRQEKNLWDDDSVDTAQVWLSNCNGTFNVMFPNDADLLKGDETNLTPGDFDGDGDTDFLRQEKNTWDDDALTTAQVWLSRRDGTFSLVDPKRMELLKGDETTLIPGYFNRDGRMDFLRQERNTWDNDTVTTAQVWRSRL